MLFLVVWFFCLAVFCSHRLWDLSDIICTLFDFFGQFVWHTSLWPRPFDIGLCKWVCELQTMCCYWLTCSFTDLCRLVSTMTQPLENFIDIVWKFISAVDFARYGNNHLGKEEDNRKNSWRSFSGYPKIEAVVGTVNGREGHPGGETACPNTWCYEKHGCYKCLQWKLCVVNGVGF